MKKLNAIRDELAKNYCVNDSWQRTDECGYDRDRRHFIDGFDACASELMPVINLMREALGNLRQAQKNYMAERAVSSKDRLNELGRVVADMSVKADEALAKGSEMLGDLE